MASSEVEVEVEGDAVTLVTEGHFSTEGKSDDYGTVTDPSQACHSEK